MLNHGTWGPIGEIQEIQEILLISAIFPSTAIIWFESIINDIQLAYISVSGRVHFHEFLCYVIGINLPRKGQTKAPYCAIHTRIKSTLNTLLPWGNVRSRLSVL